MNRISRFHTPSGDEMVVLPREDYDAIVELADQMQDVAAYDEAKAQLALGQEELIPADFANRLIAGENPIRVWRDYRGLSARDLAQSCTISPAFLSELETGKKEGGVQTLRKIAQALGVSIEDLL